MKTSFDSFQSLCTDTLANTGYAQYCKPVRNAAEKITNWTQDAARTIHDGAQSSWKKTGKHYGPAGQLLLVGLVAGIAYNVLGRKKGEKEEQAGPVRPPLRSLSEKYQPIARRRPLLPKRYNGG